MDTLTRDDLAYLAGTQNGWHVSLFMPAYPSGAETAQNPIRFHNLLREAEGRLLAVGLRAVEVKEMLEPGLRLLKDSHFWQHQAGGLAAFLAFEQFRVYRLATPLDERVVVGHRFAVGPVLPVLHTDVRYYVLALDQNAARLYHCTPYTVQEVDLPGAPDGLDDTLRFDILQRQDQFYTVPTGGQRASMVPYGVSTRADELKTQLERYFREVDRAVRARLADEAAPLVLAGVDYLLPIYRGVTAYPHLVERAILGAVKTVRPDELRDQAWPLVAPIVQHAQAGDAARYQRFIGTGLASRDVADILPAAYAGRVDALFLARGAEQWGVFEPNFQRVTTHPFRDVADIDLLEATAVQTLLSGGALYVLSAEQMPDGATLAAVYRY